VPALRFGFCNAQKAKHVARASTDCNASVHFCRSIVDQAGLRLHTALVHAAFDQILGLGVGVLVVAILKAAGVGLATLLGTVDELLASAVQHAFGGLGLALAPVRRQEKTREKRRQEKK
jgi:hypothetical protein